MSGPRKPPGPIGTLRRRLVLETPARAADGLGGAIETWGPVATVYAEVAAVTGTESYNAGRTTGRVTHEVVIRDRAGVTPRQRFRLGARILLIHAVRAVGTLRPRLECLCEERDL